MEKTTGEYGDNQFWSFPMSAVKNLQKLESLRLVSNDIENITTESLTRLNYLKSLDLSLNKFVSRTPGYGVEWRDAMPGDLVMAFASDIHHPALESGLIHQNYMVIGLVKSFVEVKWDTEMGDDEWDGIATQERLKVY